MDQTGLTDVFAAPVIGPFEPQGRRWRSRPAPPPPSAGRRGTQTCKQLATRARLLRDQSMETGPVIRTIFARPEFDPFVTVLAHGNGISVCLTSHSPCSGGTVRPSAVSGHVSGGRWTCVRLPRGVAPAYQPRDAGPLPPAQRQPRGKSGFIQE